MARMIPSVEPEAIHNEGERLVYAALRELPNDYLVLHSYPWLRPDRGLEGEPLREGEADFVLLHPDRGLLILEVKGGEPFLEGGRWYRRHGATRRGLKDPFNQARRNTYAIIKEIEARTAVRRGQFSYGYAVFFPNAAPEGDLPHNSDPTVLLAAGDLDTATSSIERAFHAWGRAKPLKEAAFKAVYEAILPRLRLVRVRGPQLLLDSERLVQLTETQQQILSSALTGRRLLVEGVAGSGKTLLAFEGAMQASIRGERALLTCYNRHLADWLRDRRDADPRCQATEGRLTVAHFHKLASDLCKQAGVPFKPSSDDVFWRSTAPDLLISAIVQLKSGGWSPYQAVFVDEGQDFAEDWWYAVEELLNDPDGDRLHVFLDQHQSLWPDNPQPPVELPPRLRLNMNCRNTRTIAGVSARLIDADIQIPPLSPVGDPPRVISATARAQQRGLVDQQVAWLVRQGLGPSQIAIIGPASLGAGPLAGADRVGGQPLTAEAAEWREGDAVLCTTARAFKGLEADAVVLYDVERIDTWFTDADLYVACTRARHILIVIAHGKALWARIKAAVDEVVA